MRRKIWLVVVLFLIVMVILGNDNSLAVPAYSMNEIIMKENAVEIIKGIRHDQIQSFLEVLQDTKRPAAVRTRAVEILGEMRAEEAVPILIDNIDMITAEVIKEKALETVYPCVSALVRIGKPSSKYALEKLQEDMSETKRLLLVTVMREVEEVNLAQFLIRQSLEKFRDFRNKENLRKSLDMLNK